MIIKGTKHDWAKGMVGLLSVFIIFGLFLLFLNKQDELMNGGNFYMFIVLIFIAGGFLLGLFYLVNLPQSHKVKVHKSSKSRSSKKGK